MHRKLRYVLPLLQMLLAVALLVWTDRWERALMRIQDMPDTPPSFTLLIAINAPLSVPRALVLRYLHCWWEDITLVVAIGMFWYWVSLNIESLHQSRRVFTFSWIPMRLALDMIAVGIGAIEAMSAFELWRDLWDGPVSLTGWLWLGPCLLLFVLWCSVLILLFGRDFAHCLRPQKVKTAVD